MVMDMISTDPTNTINPKKKKNERKIELSIRDLKFLQAVDHILDAKKKAGEKPNSDNGVGLMIYPSNRSIITAVRTSIRHIPDTALANFANMFNINMNFFYREGAPLKYQPDNTTPVNHAESKGIINHRDQSTITQVEGHNKGEIIGIVKGNVYKGNKIEEIVQKADQIVNNQFGPDDQKTYKKLLKSIRKESQNMESLILQKTEDIKKIQDLYEKEMHSERLRTKGLQEELTQIKDSERELLKKYTALLEERNVN